MNINLPLVIESYENIDIIFPYSYAKTFSDLFLNEEITKGNSMYVRITRGNIIRMR